MTRRNDKRNNRHNRQRNNKTEFSPFAQMIIGALLGKGAEMIAKKMAEEAKKTPDDKEGKPITYDDVLKELYYGKTAFWVGSTRISYAITNKNSYNDINNCASEAQCKRMVAFNKLQNIAKYLNNGWKPDFPDKNNYTICKNCAGGYCLLSNTKYQAGAIYFRTEYLANEAIRLMGEESLNDLFSTDW